MTTLLLTSCKGVIMLTDSEADIYAKIHKRYAAMDSYTAEVTMTVKSNKTESSYRLRQQYLAPDKMSAELTDAGIKTIIDGDNAVVINGENATVIPAAGDINYLFVNEFFRLYYLSQETAVSVTSGSTSGGVTRLETELIKPTAYRYRAIMTVSNQTLNPESLIITDMSGETVLRADFSSFIYNDKINGDHFIY